MTVRIEVEGRYGPWEPAPGDSEGWSRRRARGAVAGLVREQTLGMGLRVRLVDESTELEVERARTEEIAQGRAGERAWR